MMYHTQAVIKIFLSENFLDGRKADTVETGDDFTSYRLQIVLQLLVLNVNDRVLVLVLLDLNYI
jgi:hypothetical protein